MRLGDNTKHSFILININYSPCASQSSYPVRTADSSQCVTSIVQPDQSHGIVMPCSDIMGM